MTSTNAPTQNPANLLGLDYRAEVVPGGPVGTPPVPIIDAHCHINGGRAARIFGQVMTAYGIERVYSMTVLDVAADVREALGDRIRFMAVPRFTAKDKLTAFTTGYVDDLDIWHTEFGARIMKIWNAPRWRMFAKQIAGGAGHDPKDFVGLDSYWRRKHIDKAVDLGMAIMVHTADPDTWYATKYADTEFYGTKAEHTDEFEAFVERMAPRPIIGAHLCGLSEDLDRLDQLLTRHDNLYTDASATKWIVREISKHEAERVRAFMTKWKGRVLFGSDIVTHDEHLESSDPDDTKFAVQLANTEGEAFDLYASRYWALRTLWERDWEGRSPIADPDLAMVDPERFDELSSPRLAGKALGRELLETFYRGGAAETFERWYDGEPVMPGG
ncbi:MAG: hypothetical protein AAGI30_04975 [Planctomycetota bacterium]